MEKSINGDSLTNRISNIDVDKAFNMLEATRKDVEDRFTSLQETVLSSLGIAPVLLKDSSNPKKARNDGETRHSVRIADMSDYHLGDYQKRFAPLRNPLEDDEERLIRERQVFGSPYRLVSKGFGDTQDEANTGMPNKLFDTLSTTSSMRRKRKRPELSDEAYQKIESIKKRLPKLADDRSRVLVLPMIPFDQLHTLEKVIKETQKKVLQDLKVEEAKEETKIEESSQIVENWIAEAGMDVDLPTSPDIVQEVILPEPAEDAMYVVNDTAEPVVETDLDESMESSSVVSIQFTESFDDARRFVSEHIRLYPKGLVFFVLSETDCCRLCHVQAGTCWICQGYTSQQESQSRRETELVGVYQETGVFVS